MDYVMISLLVVIAGLLGWQNYRAEQARLRDMGRVCVLLSNLADAITAISEPAGRVGTHAVQPGDGRALLRARLAERAAQRG